MGGFRKKLFAAYRVLWVALFVAGLATVTYTAPRDWAQLIRLNVVVHALGFHAHANQGTSGVVGSPYGDEGRRLGFRNGDVLLTVDGRAIPAGAVRRIAMLGGPPGSTAALGGRHADGTRFGVRVARDPGIETRAYAGSGVTFAAQRWLEFAVRTLAAAASLIAAALLFSRRPRDPVAQLLAVALVTFRSDITALVPGVPELVGELLFMMTDIALWLAILLFPEGRFATRWHVIAFVAVIVSNVAQTTLWVASSFGPWIVVPLLIQTTLILIAITRQLNRAPLGIRRQQTKFVLFGIVAYCVFFIVAWAFVPFEFLSLSGETYGWITFTKRVCFELGQVAIPAGLLVSLLRYRLYDAETAISRSVAYGALTVALVAVFAGSQKVIEMLGEGFLGEQFGGLASALAAAVAAGTVAPLHHRVTRWAERRFQGNLVDLRLGLPVLVGDLRETASPSALADAALSRVERGVRAAHGAIVVQGTLLVTRDIGCDNVSHWLATQDGSPRTDDVFEVDRADPVFPMRVPLRADGVGQVGWLLLGPRPDGSFYGKDERDTLAVIADPIARALAIAMERERRETERRTRDTAAQRTLDALCQFVQERFGVNVKGNAPSAT